MKLAIQPADPSRYKLVTEEKSGGITYTPKRLADFVASQMVQASIGIYSADAAPLRILDPAVGDGELLVSLLQHLEIPHHRSIEVHGFETDNTALFAAVTRLTHLFPNVTLHMAHGDFLTFVLDQVRPHDVGSLFERHHGAPAYDLIIANPPYVRTQVMGADQARFLASQFNLAGRVDLYYAFIVAIAHVLKAGGIAGIITSNRFMTTKSGAAVRQAIRERLDVRHVWDLGDTKLFDAAVLPAVLLATKKTATCHTPAAFTSIYETDNTPTHNAHDAIAALDRAGCVGISDGRRFTVKRGTLDISGPPSAVWRVATDEGDAWLATVESHTWKRFGDVGKIRVGVKTCADNVFIRRDWEQMPEAVRPELLRPLTTHHVARRFRADVRRDSRKVLYPHETTNGQRRPVDLASYPKARTYLEQHRNVLDRRTYLIDSGREWYEIWVPQDPDKWSAPKLVFRDIAEEPTFWIDLDGTIVNGDCYWLAAETSRDVDLLFLAAAVANSDFIVAFYDHSFNNRLYAGRRRFITQYVERFPLPDPTLASTRKIVDLAKRLYDSTEAGESGSVASELNRSVWEVFGLRSEEVHRQRDL